MLLGSPFHVCASNLVEKTSCRFSEQGPIAKRVSLASTPLLVVAPKNATQTPEGQARVWRSLPAHLGTMASASEGTLRHGMPTMFADASLVLG